MVGIYLITSPSGRVYIGQSRNLKRRVKDYRNLANNKQPLLFNSFNKYGFVSHEIKMIHELPEDVSQEVLNKYEAYYLDTYRNADFKMMNVREAGSNGKLSESTKEKISIANKGKLLGIKKSEDHKRKMSLAGIGKQNWLGKKHREETKEKMSEWHKNNKKSEYLISVAKENLKKATLANIGSTHSDDTIRKMQLRSVWSKSILKLSTNGDLINEYHSIMDASRKTGINDWLIRSVLRGNKDSYGGFKWLYKSDYESINN